MPKSSDAVVMPKAEFDEEHERLIGVLESPSHADDLEEAERQKDEVKKAEPSEGQRKAGNYAKAHWRIHGMEISIENLAGSTRSGVDPSGKPWSVTLPYHYGYIRGTVGADGDHLDCMVGPLHDKGTEVTIINQKNPGGREFDEHKVMLGYPSREQALAAFSTGRSDDPNEVIDSAITVPVETFKEWLDKGSFKKKLVLKSEMADAGPVAEEFAKAEKQSHIKGHYRHINGKVVYVQDYDKTVHGDHPEATIHQRTVIGAHKSGTHTLRATDGEDREAIKEAAGKLGVPVHHIKRSGANHHGRVGAYDVIHFNTQEDAKKVHAALGNKAEVAATMPEPSKNADTGPAHGPDKGQGKGEAKTEAINEAVKSVNDAIEKFNTDTNNGLLKSELFDAYSQRKKITSEIASLVTNDIISVKDGANLEMKLISSHAFPIREDHLDGAQAMMDATSRTFVDCLLAGVFTVDQLNTAKKLSEVFESVKQFNTVAPEANDPATVGRAFSDAAHISQEALKGMLAEGSPQMGKGASETIENVLSDIMDKTQKAYMAIDSAASDVIGTFNSAAEKSLSTIGYVEPSLYNFAIHATKKRLALALGSGMGGDIDHHQGKLAAYEKAKADAQKFHDYHSLDGEALMATSPKESNAEENYKLAALSFHHKAKAMQAKGNHSDAQTMLNKAKAAASIALAHAQK